MGLGNCPQKRRHLSTIEGPYIDVRTLVQQCPYRLCIANAAGDQKLSIILAEADIVMTSAANAKHDGRNQNEKGRLHG